MKQQNRTQVSKGAWITSLVVFCVLLVFLAIACVSSAKDTLARRQSTVSLPPVTDASEPPQSPPAVSVPPENAVSGPELSADSSQTSTESGEPSESDPIVIEPVFRTLLKEETVLGSYQQNGVNLRVSKIVREELNMFVCEFFLDSPDLLHTAFAGGKITGRQYTSKIARSVNAVLAVNGDFCGYRSNGIIIREGEIVRDVPADWDLLYVDRDGNLQYGISSAFDAEELIANGARQSWCFGPVLVANGQKIAEMNSPGLSLRHREPRTAIGQLGDLHYLLFVVDAIRTDNNVIGGMTFSTLADMLVELGCVTAYNLDGGGSTTLYFNGEIINEPCVNGERAVSDIIYLR